MNRNTKIFSIAYLVTTSVAVLVMLVESFEQFDEKYLPSFMLAQKFALPVILASLSFVFLTFFEPERLERPSNLRVMRIAMVITSALFAYFVTTVNMKVTAGSSLLVYAVELAATVAVTIRFFIVQRKN